MSYTVQCIAFTVYEITRIPWLGIGISVVPSYLFRACTNYRWTEPNNCSSPKGTNSVGRLISLPLRCNRTVRLDKRTRIHFVLAEFISRPIRCLKKQCESSASDGRAAEPDDRGPSGGPPWHTASIRCISARKKSKTRYSEHKPIGILRQLRRTRGDSCTG